MSYRRGGSLHNLYFHLRMLRPFHTAARRKIYRYIAAEKKRLIESGANAELVRLQCRHLANTRNRHAERAYLKYKAQLDLFNAAKTSPNNFT